VISKLSSPPLLPELPLLPPLPTSEPPGRPQVDRMVLQGVPTTQSIWYWYALEVHWLTQGDFSATLIKLHSTSLPHAVSQLDAVAPVPPVVLVPSEGLGAMLVRHAGSQIELPAQPLKTSI